MDAVQWETFIISLGVVSVPLLCHFILRRELQIGGKTQCAAWHEIYADIWFHPIVWFLLSISEAVGLFDLLNDAAGITHAVSPAWSTSIFVFLVLQAAIACFPIPLVNTFSLKGSTFLLVLACLLAWVVILLTSISASSIAGTLFIVPMALWLFVLSMFLGIHIYRTMNGKWTELISKKHIDVSNPLNNHSVSNQKKKSKQKDIESQKKNEDMYNSDEDQEPPYETSTLYPVSPTHSTNHSLSAEEMRNRRAPSLLYPTQTVPSYPPYMGSQHPVRASQVHSTPALAHPSPYDSSYYSYPPPSNYETNGDNHSTVPKSVQKEEPIEL